MIYRFVPVVGLALSYLPLLGYPLTKEKHAEIREALSSPRLSRWPQTAASIGLHSPGLLALDVLLYLRSLRSALSNFFTR